MTDGAGRELCSPPALVALILRIKILWGWGWPLTPESGFLVCAVVSPGWGPAAGATHLVAYGHMLPGVLG